MNMLCNSLIIAEHDQRFFEEEDEAILVRKERQNNVAGYNSLVNLVNLFLTGFVVSDSSSSSSSSNSSNSSSGTTSSLTITPEFWTTFFNILQYITFFAWFAMIILFYIGGVLALFLFAIVAPATIGGSIANNGINNNNFGSFGPIFNGALFRSFEDENMPLFDKVTSVGYGFLDRSSDLYTALSSTQCTRYAMCHLSATLGDQEANGFQFKDLFRAISSTLDNKAGTEGMSRSVNVGLLTGECDEPIMNCPELAPYFKKISDTWSSYL